MTPELTKKRTVHIKTFGCQMNVYDSERMLALLLEKGYEAEKDLRAADVVLINTCSIRDKSEHKVLSLLGELKDLKAKNPRKVLGVSGCVGQRMGRTLLQKVPHLDLVFGPDSVDRVDALINSVFLEGKRTVESKLDESGRRYSQPAVVHRAKPAEFLTIMKGCDHFCTYCIVPFVRGREKSRTVAEIVGDVTALVERGTKEVTFLGQNINTYGKGTPENLAQLIEATDKVTGLARIRYLTSHPRDMGQDLIGQFGTIEKLCPQLHLPFQSGSDAVLKRMSRLYTRQDYLNKVAALRAVRSDLALSTDVIVGFPGETEDDFEQTLDLVREVGFSNAYLFKYSPRPGTRAFAYKDDQIPEPVKEERLKRLQDALNPSVCGQASAMTGETTPVLVEALDKKQRFYTGRNPHNRLVHVLNAGEACVGQVIDVEITEANGSNLKGYYVGAQRIARLPQNIPPIGCGAFEEALPASLPVA